MVEKINLFVKMMASTNCSSSILGKRKHQNDLVTSVNRKLEVGTLDSLGIAKEISSLLVPITVNSSCRSEKEKEFENEEEEEECCVTPKSEEHKIPSMTLCPPAPHKPKSTSLKRNPAIISHCRAIHFSSDSLDLDTLFSSDLTKDQHNQKKKYKKKERSSNSTREEKLK